MPRSAAVSRISCSITGSGCGGPAAGLVAEPAGPGLLAEAAHLADLVGDDRGLQDGRVRLRPALADAPADVEAGQVAHGEGPHREAEVVDHLVDLVRQRAFP